jgi:ribosomal protein L32
MAVPRREQVRGDKRRELEGSAPAAECHNASSPSSHRVCANCGYYAGRQAVEVE